MEVDDDIRPSTTSMIDDLDSEYEFDEHDMVGDDADTEQAFASATTVRPLPGFIIAGVMKSGTTSLYDLLMQHPCCRRGRQKEPHVMDWRFAQVQKYAAQYLKNRASASKDAVGLDELQCEAAAHDIRRVITTFMHPNWRESSSAW